MNQRILTAALLALAAFGIGCKGIMNSGPTSFLSSFSLEDLVKKNRSPSGQLCAKERMGGWGGGGSVGTYSLGRSSSSKSSSFSCQISALETFDDAAFIISLKADVEKEIKDAGTDVVSQGSSAPDGFYFEYRQGATQGRATISGKLGSGNYYTLEASLNEKSGS